MKKLVVIAAAFSLSAGSFAQFRLANAQSPAPPSAERATPSASDGADSIRVATATPAKPGSEKLSPEAFLDLARIFKEMVAFQEQMSAVKDKIQKFDQEIKEQATQLKALQGELQATSEPARRKQLDEELAREQAKLQSQTAETKKQFLADEAKIYSDAYEQVRSAVAEYAKEHGIRRVTRSELIARAEDNVDGSDRTAVLQRVNRPIIYLEGASESSSDITDAILQRLNGVKTR